MGLFSNNTHIRPSGWYPDPEHRGGYRWWDGYGWTDQVVNRPPNLAA